MEIGFPLLFSLIILYALFAERLGRWSITMPMVFVVVGTLLGPYALGMLQFSIASLNVELLTEITLALLLFADASTLSFQQVSEDRGLPSRLLFIGLPLTIVVGALISLAIFPAEGIVFALLLGSILAPTDAALGLPIFTNAKVPVRIRRALNVESGLNDGIATPFVALFSTLAVAEQFHSIGNPIRDALLQIGIAVGVAILVGVGSGWLFATASERGWTSKASQQLAGFAIAMTAYSGSVSLGGNGFIAAFVAGLLFGYYARHQAHAGSEMTEIIGTLLSLFVWAIFGALVVGAILVGFNLRALVFAILALTVVRMLPVTLAMLGTRLRADTVALMGWFGPRGLASVVFVLIALESFHEAGRGGEMLMEMAGWTILLSVMLHGLSAVPLADWYARRLDSAPPDIPEFKDVSEIERLRRKL